MKPVIATAIGLSLGIAVASWSGPAFAGKHQDAAGRAAEMQQRQAFEAQRQAGEAQRRAAAAWQREQGRQWEGAHQHAFPGRVGGGGGLNAGQACAMFFGRC